MSSEVYGCNLCRSISICPSESSISIINDTGNSHTLFSGLSINVDIDNWLLYHYIYIVHIIFLHNKLLVFIMKSFL